MHLQANVFWICCNFVTVEPVITECKSKKSLASGCLVHDGQLQALRSIIEALNKLQLQIFAMLNCNWSGHTCTWNQKTVRFLHWCQSACLMDHFGSSMRHKLNRPRGISPSRTQPYFCLDVAARNSTRLLGAFVKEVWAAWYGCSLSPPQDQSHIVVFSKASSRPHLNEKATGDESHNWKLNVEPLAAVTHFIKIQKARFLCHMHCSIGFVS